MKKLIGILVILSIGAATAHGQSSRKRYNSKQKKLVSIMPSIGLLSTNYRLEGDGASNIQTSAGIGFSVGLGVLFNARNSRYIDLETGLFYSEANTDVFMDFSDSVTTAILDGEITLKRLTLPLVLRLYPFKKSTGLYTRIGALAHFQMKQEFTGNFTLASDVTSSSESISSSSKSGDGIEPMVADALLGVGYNLKVTKSFNLNAELNYQYGLSKANQEGGSLKVDSLYMTIGMGF